MHAREVTLAKSASGRSKARTFKLKVLFIEGEGAWSAQCLEHDIAAQAKTLDGLLYEIERVLVSQIALDEELGRTPFEGIGPAPEKFWKVYERSETEVQRPLSGLKAGATKQPRIQPTFRVASKAA